MIQFEYSGSFLLESWISWPYPTSVTPGTNRILAQPSPECFSVDGGNNSLLFSLLSNFIVRQLGEGQPGFLGNWQARALIATMTSGGKSAGSPLTRSLLKTGQACSKILFLHFETICRGKSRRWPISLFERPSAARRMILARITSRYDDVYLRAMDCSCFFSSIVRKILYGLILGIINSAELKRHLIYTNMY